MNRWWPFGGTTAASPGMAVTMTGYEWCEVCVRNVYDESTHELCHPAIEHPNRATRRAARFQRKARP